MIDGHNDLAWAMRKLCWYDLDEIDIAGPVPTLHTDIPRLRAGGVTGQFWSVYVSPTLAGGDAVTATLEQIDFVRRMVNRHRGTFCFARSSNEILRARDSGRIASLLGMEGGHSIDNSLAVLRMMFDLGVRYMTLTHNDNVDWADSATDTPRLGGLSPFGEDVVKEMNRLGMLVDLSHVSDDVMRQAMDVSGAPVIFSHSSARAVCDVARNVPDEVLAALAGNGGLCMVTFVANFVSPAVAAWVEETGEMLGDRGGDPRSATDMGAIITERAASGSVPVATIDDVVRHFEHVREVAGVDHVGVGGDFDGARLMAEGLDDVSGYPRLFEALSARGWSAADLDKVATGNILRVMGEAESVGGKPHND
ncbi:MAG: dipeptidase [Acidimicrobiales bacterium]